MLVGVFVGLVLLRIAMKVVLEKGAEVIVKAVNPQAQFTSIYGSQLIKCPQCGASNSPEAKFCAQCGKGVAPVAKPVIKAESRPVILHDNSVYLPPVSMQYAMENAEDSAEPGQTGYEESYQEAVPDAEFSNAFGIITKERLFYFENRSWIESGLRREIALPQVVSADWHLDRKILAGQVFFAIGIFTVVFWIGVPILLYGILLYWGSPIVTLKMAGSEQPVIMKGWPWEISGARKFIEALRKKLI
jgi:hypothetical protein